MMKHRIFLLLAVASMAFVGCEKEFKPADGCFTISKTQQVKFAPGNLQVMYTIDPQTGKCDYTFTFATTQWEYLGTASTDPNTPFDLFGWGTGEHPELNEVGDSAYTTFSDWGNHTIIGPDGKPSSGWRSLTYEEWNYVINERPNAARLRCAAQIDGVPGMLLMPDNWSGNMRYAFASGYTDTIFVSNDPTNDDWQKFEAAGAVFLPAAGVRDGNRVSGRGVYGRYWTSTPNMDNEAFYFGFMSPSENRIPFRHLGFSVRLAKEQ